MAALPAVWLATEFATGGLGADPIEEITHLTGRWGLRLILFSLAVTPARRWFGWRQIAPLRRTLGLAGFGYACLHLSTWVLLEHALDASAIFEDLSERPYVMAGMGSFSLLLVLAATSTKSSIKRLGHRWLRLHQAVYAAAILAIIHQFWLTKADYRSAIVHCAILALLLAARLIWQARKSA